MSNVESYFWEGARGGVVEKGHQRETTHLGVSAFSDNILAYPHSKTTSEPATPTKTERVELKTFLRYLPD